MKKKIMLSLMLIICMMLLINVEASAATSKTTIGYPETSLYNKNDPNLVPLEPGMEMTGKTLYFNTKWNLSKVIPDGYFLNDTSFACGFEDGGGQNIGYLELTVCEDGNGWSYVELNLMEYVMHFHQDEDFAYGNSNNWLTDKFTFLNSVPVIVESDAEFSVTVACKNAEGDIKEITIYLEDLVLVTKESGHLISTNSNVVDVDNNNSNNSIDLWTIVGYGLIIAIVIFIIRSLKR